MFVHPLSVFCPRASAPNNNWPKIILQWFFRFRLLMEIQQKEAKLADDLSGCHSLVSEVVHWIDRRNEELDGLSPVSDDPNKIMEQTEELKVATRPARSPRIQFPSQSINRSID